MQMVKVRIADREDRSKCLVEVARRGRMVCLPDDIFVMPADALGLLATLGVVYEELGRGGFDYAEKALRDSVAAQA